MKRVLVSLILLCVMVISTFATVKVNFADWSKLVGQKKIAVVLNLDSLKYKKTRPFNEFLYKEKRVKDWQAESLAYFVSNFNERMAALGVETYDGTEKNEFNYIIRIVPLNVSSGGKLSGYAGLYDSNTNEMIVSFSFDTNDGDDDDEITFRDPLRELGEDFGKLFVKGLKKLK